MQPVLKDWTSMIHYCQLGKSTKAQYVLLFVISAQMYDSVAKGKGTRFEIKTCVIIGCLSSYQFSAYMHISVSVAF